MRIHEAHVRESYPQQGQLLAFGFNFRLRHRARAGQLNLYINTAFAAEAAPYSGSEPRQLDILSVRQNSEADLLQRGVRHITESCRDLLPQLPEGSTGRGVPTSSLSNPGGDGCGEGGETPGAPGLGSGGGIGNGFRTGGDGVADAQGGLTWDRI